MNVPEILFKYNEAVTPAEIREEIRLFKYTKTTDKIILASKDLDREGKVFVKCASKVLSNFGMTRSGCLQDPLKRKEILNNCWREIGSRLMEIHNSVIKSGHSRDRFLLILNENKREELIAEIWSMTKLILPYTMGTTSYGLVGASKILFAVLPEIVLPVDNSQWLHVFKTVDLGDVIRRMTSDIQLWEKATGKKLNEMDSSGRLTTLPSVYNVMAMAARP